MYRDNFGARLQPDRADFSQHPVDKTTEDLSSLQALQLEMEQNLVPFYEALVSRWPWPYPATASLLAAPILILHFIWGQVNGVVIFADYSWLLSIMIAFILVLVIWATKRLRAFAIALYSVFRIDPSDRTLYRILRETLGSRSMLRYGVFFGLANAAFGLFYGIWYRVVVLQVWLLVQFFMVGFVSGLAICGIVGVLRLVDYVSREEDRQLDLTAEDNCGGTSQIGNALLQFSAVSLMAGVLIAYYIYSSPWTHRAWLPVTYTLYFWMGFPHFAALTVLLYPLLRVHGILAANKSAQGTVLRNRRANLGAKLMDIADGSDLLTDSQVAMLSLKYRLLTDMCSELGAVREWPYDLGSGYSYVIMYLLTLIVPLLEIWQRLSTALGRQ